MRMKTINSIRASKNHWAVSRSIKGGMLPPSKVARSTPLRIAPNKIEGRTTIRASPVGILLSFFNIADAIKSPSSPAATILWLNHVMQNASIFMAVRATKLKKTDAAPTRTIFLGLSLAAGFQGPFLVRVTRS